MSLAQRTEMRRCGRRYKTRTDAALSKGALSWGKTPVPCAIGCGGWHLEAAETPAAPKLVARRDTGPSASVRLAAYERDGWACVCCGTSILTRPHSLGHRMRRSQGGSNSMSNLLTFLGLGSNPLDRDDHHARIDSRRNPDDELNGYTVRSHDDPRLVSVSYFESPGGSGFTAWLADDGSLLFERPESGAA